MQRKNGEPGGHIRKAIGSLFIWMPQIDKKSEKQAKILYNMPVQAVDVKPYKML